MVCTRIHSHWRQNRLRQQITDRLLDKQANLLRTAFEHCSATLRVANGGLNARRAQGRSHRRGGSACMDHRKRRRRGQSQVHSADPIVDEHAEHESYDEPLLDMKIGPPHGETTAPQAVDSGSWLDPDDFLNLVFRAGLRGDDVEWVGAFDGICQDRGQTPVPGIRSSAFVRLVMDDLVRRCQYTSDSLMEMLQLVQGINAAPSEHGHDARVEQSSHQILEVEESGLPDLPEVQLPKIDELETTACNGIAKESPRLSVWGPSADRSDFTKTNFGASADEEASRLERRQQAEAELAAFHEERQREIKERRERNRAAQRQSGDEVQHDPSEVTISEQPTSVSSAAEPLRVWRNSETEKMDEHCTKVTDDEKALPGKTCKNNKSCSDSESCEKDYEKILLDKMSGCTNDAVDCIKKVSLDPYPVMQTEAAAPNDWEHTLSDVFR